tara:strand:+ start:158 stop:445 length:288 start_codon:yes stop_codon:yes gene_type:complete
MSLAERDELIQKLNNALNMVCEEVENVKKRVNNTENPHMKNILPESENEQGAIDNLLSYLEESLQSTDDKQVKKKIKLAMKQVSSTIKKKSSDSV